MKLLIHRLFKLHSGILFHRCNQNANRFGYVQRSFHFPISSNIFKKIRNASIIQQSVKEIEICDRFRYHYDVNELLDSLKQQSCEFHSETLKDFLNANNDNVQHVINYIILAAKYDHNVEDMVKVAAQDNSFDTFLNRVGDSIVKMTADEVVSTLIAFNLSNIPLHHPINRRLTVQTSHMLNEMPEFPLKSLSNLAIFSRVNETHIYPPLFCADGTSHIVNHLDKCDNIRDLYYITAYFNNLHVMLTKELISRHKTKMKQFLNEIDPKANLKELFTILTFYRNSMTFKNSRIIRNILLLIGDDMRCLSNSQLQSIAWTRDLINEPSSLVPKLVAEAESRPDKSTNLDLIYCRFSKLMPDHLEKVSHEMLAIVEKLDAQNIIQNNQLFAILKNKRYISVKEVYYKYWEKTLDDLTNINIQGVDTDSTLATLCYRYCFLQRGMTSRYRNLKFESLLRELTLIEIKYGVSGWKPNRLAKLATFIIGYGHDPTTDQFTLPEYFVKKIEEMAQQFTVNEVIDISVGIEIFRQNGLTKGMNKRFAAKIVDRIGRLEDVVDGSIERLIDERKNIQIDAILLLIRAYANQKVLKRTRILDKLIKKLEEICTDDVIVTARTIQYATGSLNRIASLNPNLCQHMLRFVNENMSIVGADTVAYLLFYLFSMGYEPHKDCMPTLVDNVNINKNNFVNDFDDTKMIDFDNCIRIINRDFELIPAWLVVQASLALSFYQVLTIDLINRIFNIDFVTRLENELSDMYHSKNYPKNILNLIMNLNRSVCLNYPEANVPWFQQNFIESQLATDLPKSGPYMNDIFQMLLAYVGGDKSLIRINHITPYGYRIPFVIYFNSHKQLVPPPFDEGPQTLNKIAIIPLSNQSFRLNDTKMRGFNRLQERHLNILGYDVIQICYREWNSIHMNLPGARADFLRKFLNKYDGLIE